MQNEDGKNVDLYIPRKCSWTNRILHAKDHASVQINVADVDPETGRMTGTHQTIAFSGFVRQRAEADMAFTEITKDYVVE